MIREDEQMDFGDTVLDAGGITCVSRPNGGLDIRHPDGELFDVHLIPAFPLTSQERMIVALDATGEEVALIDDAAKLAPDSRQAVAEELERSYFMPRIVDIVEAEEKLSVLTLEVETNRGPRTIQIRNARRSIRRMPHNQVIIRDVDGNRYKIRDWTELPAYGRDLLLQYM